MIVSSLWEYIHTQNIPSDTWTINHGTSSHPSVTIIDSAGNEVVGCVQYTDSNQIIITFSRAFSGRAILR